MADLSAAVYAYLARNNGATVRDVTDDLGLAQGTAYGDIDRLVENGVVEVTDDGRPRRYGIREIDLTVTGTGGEYAITPIPIDAVGRRENDADIDRHGVAGLATAFSYAVARERGEVTRRLMASDLDVSPLAAEMILQVLRPVVHEHRDTEPSEGSLDNGTDDT